MQRVNAVPPAQVVAQQPRMQEAMARRPRTPSPVLLRTPSPLQPSEHQASQVSLRIRRVATSKSAGNISLASNHSGSDLGGPLPPVPSAPSGDASFWIDTQRRIEEYVAQRVLPLLEAERDARVDMQRVLEERIALVAVEASQQAAAAVCMSGAASMAKSPSGSHHCGASTEVTFAWSPSPRAKSSTAADLDALVRSHVALAASELRGSLSDAMDRSQRSVAQGLLKEQNVLALNVNEQIQELRVCVDDLMRAGRFAEVDSKACRSTSLQEGSHPKAQVREEVADIRVEVEELRTQIRRILEQVGSVMDLNSQLTGQLAEEQHQFGEMRARIDEAVGETGSLAAAAAEVAGVVAWLAAARAPPTPSSPNADDPNTSAVSLSGSGL